VRFANLRAVSRSTTFDTPVSTTVALAETAEELVRAALAQHPEESKISLLAISVTHLMRESDFQLALPLGSPRAVMRCAADRAVDTIRERFGWQAIGYGSVVLSLDKGVPDEFRSLAEKELL
jgi:DNA polymerase-4